MKKKITLSFKEFFKIISEMWFNLFLFFYFFQKFHLTIQRVNLYMCIHANNFSIVCFLLFLHYTYLHNFIAFYRKGSGSACRSVYGGFVHWKAGTKTDGSDSIAVQLAPKSHWPEMRVIILVVRTLSLTLV